MSEHDVEALLADLKPAGLSANSDVEILATIGRVQTSQVAATTRQRGPTRVYARPVPAWAAAAACLVVGVAAWMAGGRGRVPPASTIPTSADLERAGTHRPVLHRVHIETDIFAATPRRSLDVRNWSPLVGTTRENRS